MNDNDELNRILHGLKGLAPPTRYDDHPIEPNPHVWPGKMDVDRGIANPIANSGVPITTTGYTSHNLPILSVAPPQRHPGTEMTPETMQGNRLWGSPAYNYGAWIAPGQSTLPPGTSMGGANPGPYGPSGWKI